MRGSRLGSRYLSAIRVVFFQETGWKKWKPLYTPSTPSIKLVVTFEDVSAVCCYRVITNLTISKSWHTNWEGFISWLFKNWILNSSLNCCRWKYTCLTTPHLSQVDFLPFLLLCWEFFFVLCRSGLHTPEVSELPLWIQAQPLLLTNHDMICGNVVTLA